MAIDICPESRLVFFRNTYHQVVCVLEKYSKSLGIAISAILLFLNANGQSGKKLKYSMQLGYHQEDFRWSIAGNTEGTNPNVYSELIWKNMSAPTFSAEIEWNPISRIVVLSDLHISQIITGKVSDKDYLGDNRTHNSYSRMFEANKGNIQAYDLMIGYRLLSSDHFMLTAALGYSIQAQRLWMLKESENLHSTYITNWHGFNFRLATYLPVNKTLGISNRATAEMFRFNARANWNLVDNFQHPLSFEDVANGFGIKEDFRLELQLNSAINLNMGGVYYHACAGKGTDKLFLSNGTVATTQFNGAVRSYFQATTGIRFSL
ncbi:omptin family outer membrane protease [Chitinophaga sp. G-6-1-13]|uniref:Omptin family outer membrane protease n=1 Tax=Chitinophaga fulva TaxID=2728842 RepID=A0A848GNX2_9BACT|nr:omptin family outer membrane protease [Chitinophaga fulva]NML40104.1 omptin family outer membrane protease [Chitinophaga fulva]